MAASQGAEVEALHSQLFEQMPCYVTAQDRDFRVIAANQMVCNHFDLVQGGFCYELYKGRSERCPRCPVERTFKDGQVHQSEEIVRRKGGQEVVVMVYTAPLRSASGEIVAAVEVSADISEIKQLQQKYRTLFEEAPCYISVQDRNLRIVEANRRFRNDFGEGTGSSCFEVYKHRSEPCMSCLVAKTFQDGQTHQSEEVVTTHNGHQENVICYTAPICDPAGEIVSVMEMSTNITELRQIQDRLTSLGLLVGSISHGIKGLLNGLDGGVYLMETGFRKDDMERVRKGWDMMQRNVDRIRSLVLNVLYYAKDREVSYQEIDLQEVTASAGNVLASRAGQLGVKLEIRSEPGTFEGDHHAIHSLLVNLAENSLDACRIDKKDVQHRVSLSASLDGAGVVFQLQDNGIGMDQQTREKAFSLFFSSKGAEGTGLGLFISHKIVRSHGGTIEVSSSVGEGSRFVVRLPRTRQVDQ